MAGTEDDRGHSWPAEDPDARLHGQPVPPAPGQASPQRIDPDPGTHQESPVSRRRRMWPWLVTVAVLLVAGLAATMLAPPTANRLGLPWAPNAPQGPEPGPSAVERTIHGVDTDGTRPTPEGVTAAISEAADGDSLAEFTGIVMDPVTGVVLWDREASEPTVPASTTKLLTAAAALLSLDATARIPTTVVAGEDPGSVVVVGGGDPTLASTAEGAPYYSGAATLEELAEQVLDTTGGAVDTVSIDLSTYAGETIASGWTPDDTPSTYSAPVVPAMLDGGRLDPADQHAERSANPARDLVSELAELLDARVGDPSVVTAADGAEVLAEVVSPPLSDLLRSVLVDSDNVVAEALARQVALAEGEEASFEGAATATLDVLERNGFDTVDITLRDGSGLSRDNRIPARLLADVLAAASAPVSADSRASNLRPLLDSLAVAGGSGTLTERYSEAPTDRGGGWVRAKTGTLSEVNTLAGTVLDGEGRVLVFAVMSTGASIHDGRQALDEIATALRECGCD
ncbi:D-alanyl-D-alanine carboxypeptidase/D-alanyl-D-alanine-endopeptidase [Haloechinothrix sp. LS1_15]|uniref:D-alanyl-D-alanine carboxypeptidase/D-alanyl-D-alanine endopeptidase n=1 Tax=Haloechinothrix sp. LS1_15 TaxID=2652248 RepID=UPI002943FBDD|nr:D-alanyl-D-alanine carboxypeptidase/D-alanyl-D-alanine-endopeptidase [Haloechinothrix sp. LS1_15]MDV6011414.1 D-alanyl-D-alanine carboxypeptidase/D-alanyl-D-alanine-endopeptidase [Haloechinothrix sp. LS1_15]